MYVEMSHPDSETTVKVSPGCVGTMKNRGWVEVKSTDKVAAKKPVDKPKPTTEKN